MKSKATGQTLRLRSREHLVQRRSSQRALGPSVERVDVGAADACLGSLGDWPEALVNESQQEVDVRRGLALSHALLETLLAKLVSDGLAHDSCVLVYESSSSLELVGWGLELRR